VTVIMHCDYDAENNSYPELFSHVSSKFFLNIFKASDICNKSIFRVSNSVTYT